MDDFLMHYGRKGMKWYQHIYGEVQPGAKYAQEGGASQDSGSSKTGVIRRISSAVKGEKDNTKTTRKLSDVSNEELREAITRAQLIKQYRELYRDLSPKKVSVGKQIMQRVIAPVMEQQAKNFLNAEIGKFMDSILKDSKSNSGRIEDMSDADLKKAVTRATLEEQYRKLKANKN